MAGQGDGAVAGAGGAVFRHLLSKRFSITAIFLPYVTIGWLGLDIMVVVKTCKDSSTTNSK